MYFVFMKLERNEGEKAETTCYMERVQLQDMKKEVQEGVASYDYANTIWNIKEFYYVKLNEVTKTIN